MKTRGYLVVVQAGDDLKCFGKVSRDGLLWKAGWMSSPTIFINREDARKVINKTIKKSPWVKKFKVQFKLQPCAIVTRMVK